MGTSDASSRRSPGSAPTGRGCWRRRSERAWTPRGGGHVVRLLLGFVHAAVAARGPVGSMKGVRRDPRQGGMMSRRLGFLIGSGGAAPSAALVRLLIATLVLSPAAAAAKRAPAKASGGSAAPLRTGLAHLERDVQGFNL